MPTPRTNRTPPTAHTVRGDKTRATGKPKATTKAEVTTKPAAKPKADVVARGGRRLGEHEPALHAGSGSRTASLVAVRATTTTKSKAIIHELPTRKQFDALFAQGASVTAGAPSELKFLIDRKTNEVFFIPPKYPFHYTFYKEVLGGKLDDGAFDQIAYDRPDREFIAGTVTAYDSYVDPKSGKKGQICFSLWPTDRFDASLLKEAHDKITNGLKFLGAGDDIAFRPGGPIQDKLVAAQSKELAADHIGIKTNLEISQGLKYMALSKGDAIGKLVIIDKGEAMPQLGRTDVAIFLGDVPPTAPPVAAIITAQVQTYNSHLGIKYRQDKTPYFYKAFSDAEIADLKKLAGKPVKVSSSGEDGTISAATQKDADAYVKKTKPKGHVRMAPNLKENRARPFSELAKMAVGKDGKWNPEVLAAYGRKTLGVVELAELERTGKLNVSAAGEPQVVTPKEPMGIPANWYTRFIKSAVDKNGVTFSARIKTMTGDARFQKDDAWRADQLATIRKDIEKAKMPADLLKDITEQVAVPYLQSHPGAEHARLRSSAPVVEDSGPGSGKKNENKMPNMAGAFDSHSAKWKGKDPGDVGAAFADALQKDYAAVWNDRAVSELMWHNADMDEEAVAMAVLVMPNEEEEKGNGVLRVNSDLAGFFSITGETQYGENLVTNPEQGATPDTFIDGNYDILNGVAKQDIEYERVSNQKSTLPGRDHCYTDAEIHAAYKAMQVIRDHFAGLEGKKPQDYVDECETKITSDGHVQFKQERPWVE